MGLVEKDYYGEVRLTEKGKTTAGSMQVRLNCLSEELSSLIKSESAFDAAVLLLSGLDEDCFVCFDGDRSGGE